jgi:hypothetical protein
MKTGTVRGRSSVCSAFTMADADVYRLTMASATQISTPATTGLPAPPMAVINGTVSCVPSAPNAFIEARRPILSDKAPKIGRMHM